MAITITGSKASGTVVSYSSKQLTISGTTLASGDYSDQRVVGVWTSGGAYRGMTWVRRFISSTVLEMEFDFIDKDGNTITPVASDTFQVSQNFADVVTAGLSLSANIVSQSDNIIVGTGGVSDSVCFYDEDKRINITNDNNNFPYRFEGGLFVLGHLLDYEDRTFFNSVDLYSSGGGNIGDQLRVNNPSAKVWWMGGKLQFAVTPARLPGGANGTPAEWQKWWGIETNGDFVTPSGGAAWSSNAASQQFINCGSLVSSKNAIGFRLANSDAQGGFCKISGGSAISVFGSDAAGSFTIYAPAGERFKVLDIGTNLSKTAFWRSMAPVSQSITITNVISTDFRLGLNLSPGTNQNPNANATVNFSGRYSNAVAGTKIILRETNNVAIADSGISVSGEDLVLSVKYADVTGHTLTVHETDFGWAAFRYGYQVVSGVFAVEDAATLDGTAKDIVHGEALVQAIDGSITEPTKVIVDAYTELETPQKFYDRAVSWLESNVTNEQAFLVSREGNTINAGTYNVTLDATASEVFAFDGSTITIKAASFVGNIQGSGTFTLLNGAEVLGAFGSTVVYPWEVSNVEAGSTLQLFNVTQDIEIENLVVSGTAGTKVTASGTYATSEAVPGDTIRLRITCQAGVNAFLPYETFGVATASGASFRADQQPDAIYNANNIDGSAIAGITLTPDYTNVQIDLDDQEAPYEISAQAIYNYYSYLITTPQGIANFYGSITPVDQMNYRINASVVPMKIQNTGSTDVVLNGGRLYRDDNVSVLDTGTGSGTGSIMQDTGFLVQYIQPQVGTALNNYGAATSTELSNTEATLKKKITQAALI